MRGRGRGRGRGKGRERQRKCKRERDRERKMERERERGRGDVEGEGGRNQGKYRSPLRKRLRLPECGRTVQRGRRRSEHHTLSWQSIWGDSLCALILGLPPQPYGSEKPSSRVHARSSPCDPLMKRNREIAAGLRKRCWVEKAMPRAEKLNCVYLGIGTNVHLGSLLTGSLDDSITNDKVVGRHFCQGVLL